MSNIKGLLKETRYHDICDILKTAGQLGQNEAIEVHAVGGFVRDLLMERDINDIDIVAVGKGIPFAEKLADEGAHIFDSMEELPQLLGFAR